MIWTKNVLIATLVTQPHINKIMQKFNAVVYIRVSSKPQVDGKSLQTQEQECFRFAERNGWNVIEVFREEAESAKFADRPELLKALTYCRKNQGKVQSFIVYKLDRFARNQLDHHSISNKLSQYEVCLRSATEPVDDSMMGKAFGGMIAAWAELDNAIRGERARTNMRALLRSGIFPFHPPFGYKSGGSRSRNEKKRQPDPIDEERFYVIQRGLREYATGIHSIASLTRRFQEWGLITSASKKIYNQQVEKMLVNPFYAGYLKDPWWTEADLPEPQLVKGLHKNAIEWSEFQKIQLIKAGKSVNAKPRARANPEFPLRAFARCSKCYRPVTGSISHGNGGAYSYYHCSNRQCELYGKTILKKELEDSFIEYLRQVTPSDASLTLFKEVALDVWQTKRNEFNGDAARHEKKLEEIKAQINQLISMRARNIITDEQLQEQKQPLEELSIVEQVALSETKIEEWDIEAAINYATHFMTDLARQWNDYSLEQKQRFQQLVFPEGIIYEKNSGCRTNRLSPIYELFSESQIQNANLVAPPGIGPGLPH